MEPTKKRPCVCILGTIRATNNGWYEKVSRLSEAEGYLRVVFYGGAARKEMLIDAQYGRAPGVSSFRSQSFQHVGRVFMRLFQWE
jgi:hypothetical protein